MHLTRLGPCRRKIHIEYVSDNNTLAILWCSCFLVSYPSDAIDLKIQNPIWDNQMGKIHPPGPGPRFLRFFSNFRWNKMEAAPWCLRMGPGPTFSASFLILDWIKWKLPLGAFEFSMRVWTLDSVLEGRQTVTKWYCLTVCGLTLYIFYTILLGFLILLLS